ncbi:MAG: hypothetical protein K2H92_06645 [Bacteroidaceae bacterium]|nr:hypothetical protein [Bacteroidaceae bacterium]
MPKQHTNRRQLTNYKISALSILSQRLAETYTKPPEPIAMFVAKHGRLGNN